MEGKEDGKVKLVGKSLWSDAFRRLKKNRAAVVSAVVLIVLFVCSWVVPWISPYAYDKTNLAIGPTAPSLSHWMGTDFFGRDLFTRLFFGGRISFMVALTATSMSLLIGVTWGGIAGYVGGKVDALMMRIVDILYTFPFLIFVILLMVFFAGPKSPLYSAFLTILSPFSDDPKGAKNFAIFQIFVVFFAIGSISWLTMARMVRGQVLSLRGQPFVEAARSIGVGPTALIFRHLLPNALGPIIVYTTLTIPEVMMTEAFLSFLGLGTQEPLSSWGLLAATGAETMDYYWWQLVFPSALLAATLFCFNFLGDGLRDAMDPRVRKD
ncbi:MAG: ABC transporter permease subunit [Polyangiaceae bacterium]|nr:ABC transporter permease subunit [Polyangiaceae bacterium]